MMVARMQSVGWEVANPEVVILSIAKNLFLPTTTIAERPFDKLRVTARSNNRPNNHAT